jgi:hypothetical protein
VNGLAYVGPVKVDWHSEPTYTWESKLDPAGTRDVKITGELEWQTAEQLSELAANTDAAPTIGGRKGVLVPIWTNNAEELAQFHGWYLLESFSLSADVDQSKEGLPVGTITACYLGDGVEVPIARSAAPKGNDFGLTAKSLVVSPFRPEHDAGDRFILDPGGTFGTREYDPSYPWDSARPTPDGGTARIGFYAGTVTDSTDALDLVCFPKVHLGPGIPAWLEDQGGNVRAVDRRTSPAREVYGPHPFLESTDLLVTNGLVSFWVGNRGLVPFLNVQAVSEGSRREVGTILFGTSAPLRRARMTYLTLELAVVALTVEGYGDILVSLRRGERQLTISSPSSAIRPRPSGVPPTSRAVQAFNDVGRFGLGLDAEGNAYESATADLRLLWPPTVSKDDFGRVFWLSPLHGSTDSDDLGQWTLFNESGAAMARLLYDSTTSTFSWRVGSQTLASSPLSWDALDDLLIGVRFSSEAGMALSVRHPDGTVSHSSDSSATVAPLGVPKDMGYFVNFSTWGDGNWGDGVWGGVTSYPGGVIDNDMIFDGWFTDIEFERLAEAERPLDGLPQPEARLVWYAPFDVDPLPLFMGEADGRIEQAEPNEWGQTWVVAFLNSDHTESAVLLATDDSLDSATAQHEQSAAERAQQLRVR